MRKFQRIIALVFAVVMLAACSDGDAPQSSQPSQVGNSSASGDGDASAVQPITFTFFDKNKGDMFDDPVAKEIIRRTGVTLEIQQPTTDSEEKLTLMLTGGDYADMILFSRTSASLQSYVDSGALLPLNDLIEEHGPNIKKMYGDVLNMSRYPDGNIYYLNSWYGMDPDPVYGVCMRMDYAQELAGDKATTGEYFTLDEYYQMLVDFKEKYPSINGAESIPLSINGEALSTTLATFKGMFGIETYYLEGDNVYFDLRHPRYIEVFKFLNKCYLAGLVDTEWVSVKRDLWEQKLASDTVFSTAAAWWDPGNANTTLQSMHDNDSAAQFFAYKVVPEGMDPSGLKLGGRSTLGWDGVAITDKCKDPVRAIQFLDFLVSEEGQYLLNWGVEGEHWDMVDGVHTPRQEVLDALKEDINSVVVQMGIRKWNYCIKNGNGEDGTPYDLIYKLDRADIDTFAIKSLADTNFDNTPYQGLTTFAPNSEEGMINQAITEELTKYQPRIIMAESEAECVRLYEELVQRLDELGADKVEAYMTAKYQEKLSLWE